MSTTRPKRPSDEDYARALGLYRANATPETIAERVGLTIEQVEHAQLEGWPPIKGKHARPALRAWEHEIDDRLHRSRLAALDWAQAVSEASAVSAKDYGTTLKQAGRIKQAILSMWGAQVSTLMAKAKKERDQGMQITVKPEEMALPIDVVRSLTILNRLMDPTQQARLADVYRFLRGGEEEEDGVGEMEKIQAALEGMTEEQLEAYGETGERPAPVQKVIDFPQTGSG